MNSQPSSVSTRSIVFDGGGAPATTIRTRAAARHGLAALAPSGGGIEDRGDHGGRAVEQRHAFGLDAAQDLCAVDLADDHLAHAHRGERVWHAPAVAVERGQRVQIDVAIADTDVPAERHRVEPAAAMRELHALGPRGGAGGVVDRDGRGLVGDA